MTIATGEHIGDSLDTEQNWKAIIDRDGGYDGSFVYCVKTTGIYCHPSCSSKKPKRENILFAPDPAAAERLGYRACQRCGSIGTQKTSTRDIELVAKMCRVLEANEENFDIEKALQALGVSRTHFHRLFKSVTGTTPKRFQNWARARRIAGMLPLASTVTDAIYAAGFGSNGRFYADANKLIGMTPTQYKNQGAETRIRFAIGECTLGSILVAATEKGVCMISLADEPETLVRQLEDGFPSAELEGGDEDFEKLVGLVVGKVENPGLDLVLPLDIRGTVFQTKVWDALQKIPSGRTATYSEIAELMGQPGSARAVAKACASNKIALAIPCHRVIRQDGSLSGYRWGVERKREILKRENGAARLKNH